MSPSSGMQTSEQDQIEGVMRRLRRLSDGTIPDSALEAEVRGRFASWADASVRDFLPVLVERSVSESLGLRAWRADHGVARTA
jgi:hypothetical protein